MVLLQPSSPIIFKTDGEGSGVLSICSGFLFGNSFNTIFNGLIKLYIH